VELFRNIIAVILAFIAGIFIWALSPEFTGHEEPWDGDLTYFISSLFISGVIFGVIQPVKIWRWLLALLLGQLFYLLTIGWGPLVILGAVYLAGFSLITYAGALLSSKLINTYKTSPSENNKS
jgi:hypothetical protein